MVKGNNQQVNRIRVKAFLSPKTGGIEYSQDQLRMQLSKGRFAVADGVSNSYHPEVIAKALCNAFVKDSFAVEQWPMLFQQKIHKRIVKIWKREIYKYEKTLSGRRLLQEKMMREFLPAGASTLVGIAIDINRQVAYYQIIGDSTLFVFDRNGSYHSFCTNQREKRKDGKSYVVYDNHPQCIIADGRLKGAWLSGEVVLPNDGFIVLMTDAASEWLQEKSIKDPDTIKRLWEFEDARTFDSFVNKCREQELKMNDDVAAVILKCESSSRIRKENYINMLKRKRI